MADLITKETYKQYAKRIASVLEGEDFYEQFKKRVDKGTKEYKLSKKRLIQDISLDWIETIDDVLPNLDNIVRNPRKFIVQEEDIVDVALAKSISTESIKFLAQHTNMISKVDKDGTVTPSKILNISKEESFEIYENRFIYTLLLKLKDFVTMRYDKIKKATATQDVLELDLESKFNLPSKKITYKTQYYAQLSFDEIMRLDPDTLEKIERVAKIDRIITDFLSSSFAKSMRSSAPVRPPIMRTNVILKNPDFKKALTLWQFIETYNVTAGFSSSDEVEDYEIEKDSNDRLGELITLNTMIFESIYDQFETDMNMEDKEFADFLKVGDMDFAKDNLERDEYSQKLDEEIEDEDEDERVEEVKPQDSDEADTEIPPEEQEPEIEQEEVEKEVPEPEIIEKEVIVEVEKIIEVEKFKEIPPKDAENELDLEPDADQFDAHLFEVRKLFKRPDDDKIKQEEIIKVKDAIDRCLTAYRKIKQEELDERDRQDRIKRRREDIEKRANAFKKAREDMAGGLQDDATTFFGVDPFEAQKAKIARKKKEEEEKAKLKVNKSEHLDLDDPQIPEVQKEIEEMEKANAKRAKKNALIDQNLDAIDAIMPLDGTLPEKKEKLEEGELPQFVMPKEEEEEKPQEIKARKRGGIKLSKDVNALDPYAVHNVTMKEQNVFDLKREQKAQVGDINIKEEKINAWGDNAKLGDLTKKEEKPQKEKKSKSKKAPKAETPKVEKKEEEKEKLEVKYVPIEEELKDVKARKRNGIRLSAINAFDPYNLDNLNAFGNQGYSDDEKEEEKPAPQEPKKERKPRKKKEPSTEVEENKEEAPIVEEKQEEKEDDKE